MALLDYIQSAVEKVVPSRPMKTGISPGGQFEDDVRACFLIVYLWDAVLPDCLSLVVAQRVLSRARRLACLIPHMLHERQR